MVPRTAASRRGRVDHIFLHNTPLKSPGTDSRKFRKGPSEQHQERWSKRRSGCPKGRKRARGRPRRREALGSPRNVWGQRPGTARYRASPVDSVRVWRIGQIARDAGRFAYGAHRSVEDFKAELASAISAMDHPNRLTDEDQLEEQESVENRDDASVR